MKRPLTILLLEDSAADAVLIERELEQLPFPFQCNRVVIEADYLAALDSLPDIVLADYRLPRFSGHDALRLLQERKLDVPFIIISGIIGEDLAVATLRAGADDYLLKDRLGRLSSAVTHALEQRELGRKKRQAEDALREAHAELEDRVQRRTEQLADANRVLEAEVARREKTEAALRQLEKEISEISEREQQRLGVELHEGLGQALAGCSFLAQGLQETLQQKHLPEAAQAARLAQILNQAVRKTHNLATAFYPIELEKNGLIQALRQFAETINTLFQTDCVVECDDDFLPGNRSLEIHLSRIIPEAVRTAIQRGRAKQVHIHCGKVGKQTALIVTSDATPPSENELADEMGFKVMQYRSGIIGATMSVDSASNRKGTTVTCQFGRLADAPAASISSTPGIQV